MPLPIQRVPAGLSEVLSIFGGLTPRALADEVSGTLDLLQFYGRTQLQGVSNANAAATNGATVVVTVPPTQHWILFHCFARGVVPAAATHLDLRVVIDPGQSVVAVGTAELPIVVGRVTIVPFVPPYPLLLGPGSRIGAQWAFNGGGNDNLLINAVVGVLG